MKKRIICSLLTFCLIFSIIQLPSDTYAEDVIFDFEEDIAGEAPTGFICGEEGGPVSVVDSYGRKCLFISNDFEGRQSLLKKNITPISAGIVYVSFKFLQPNPKVDGSVIFALQASGDNVVVLETKDGGIYYKTKTGYEAIIENYSVHFNCYIDDTIAVAPEVAENIVVIMQTGSSYIPCRWDKKAKGIIQMWYAGESGGKAMADILFGKVNPSGKLSETFPIKLRENFEHIGYEKSIDYKEGMEIGYRYYDKHPDEIWYPFGHGISYTAFEYLNPSANVDNENVKISVDVKNKGEVAGKEAVQIYFGKKDSIFNRPIKELKAFTKIEVLPGETKVATVIIPLSELAVYDTSRSMWRVEEGEYQVYIAASSQDIRHTLTIEI